MNSLYSFEIDEKNKRAMIKCDRIVGSTTQQQEREFNYTTARFFQNKKIYKFSTFKIII